MATDDGLMFVALWNSEDDFHTSWNGPQLAQVASELGMPEAGAITVQLHRTRRHHVDP